MSDKTDCAQALADKMTGMAQLEELIEVIKNRGYHSGGSDPATDEDLAEISGMTAAVFNDLIYVGEEATKLINNVVAAHGNYRATIDLVRSDY